MLIKAIGSPFTFELIYIVREGINLLELTKHGIIKSFLTKLLNDR